LQKNLGFGVSFGYRNNTNLDTTKFALTIVSTDQQMIRYHKGGKGGRWLEAHDPFFTFLGQYVYFGMIEAKCFRCYVQVLVVAL